MVTKITDLQGNIFKVKNWDLVTKIPILKNQILIFTRDLETQKRFNLSRIGNDYLGYFYNQGLNLYVKVELKLKCYDESKDIRQSHKYIKHGRKK